MDNRYVKIFASGSKAPLKATPGHLLPIMPILIIIWT